ncbi:MAG: 4-hydroxy-2-oxovalerate aldolase [Segetibacter sp.]|nr:4-hydroxy-2-oxovalerate aldolase [Segetibacter sp.]
MKNLKSKIKSGQAVNGCWLNLGSSLTAEIVGLAGFDWVLIDLEHGAGNEKDVLAQLQALEHTHTAAIVRVESAEKQRIHRVLDVGAEGVMCPHINNLDQAKKVVSGLRYPPEGSRGVAKMVRASGFGKNFDEYRNSANENIVGVVQIETIEALDHLDEIAALDGIDVLFIGPADLTMALGIFGQFDHPLFVDAVKATVSAAQKAGKSTGILIFNPNDYSTYYNLGIRMIACGADATFVAEGARNMSEKLNSIRSTHSN